MDLSYIDEPLGKIEVKPWHIATGIVALGGIGALIYFLFIKKSQPGVFVTGPGAPGPMAPSAASASQCVQLGVQSEPLFDETNELIMAVRAAQAQGKKIFKVPTGKTAVLGSRDRFPEVTIWACPPGQKPPPAPALSGDDDEEDGGIMNLLERTRRRNR